MTGPPLLTDHELVVLRLLARGRTYAQIASVLKVKPEAAGKIIATMQAALRVRTNAQAVAVGYETGILKVGEMSPDDS